MSATSTLVIGAKKAQKLRILNQASCICYPMQFWKDKGSNILALLNSKNEVNAMTLAYAAQLGFKMQRTNVSASKINGSSLATYSIVIAVFQVLDKLGRSRFF